MPSPTATRSKHVKVTMTPEMHARLVGLCERLGQTPATLASVAISLYVAQQEAGLNAGQRAVDNITAQLGPHLAEQLRIAMGSDDS
jgi:hypothetical protein